MLGRAMPPSLADPDYTSFEPLSLNTLYFELPETSLICG